MGMIRFEVECRTQWGQSVAVCGSGRLGDWDVGRCLLLEPTAYPVWSGEVSAGPANFEYKYVLVLRGVRGAAPQLLAWESAGPNRRAQLQGSGRLLLSDHFGDVDEAERSGQEAKLCADAPTPKPRLLQSVREVLYFSAEELAARLGDPRLQVVDVRDDDFAGGHIVGARHCPSATFRLALPELAREFGMADKTLVFHCMYSRARGPTCARLFLRHLEENLPRWQCAVYVLSGGYDRWELLFASEPNSEKYIADRPALPHYGPKNFYIMNN